MLARAMTGVSIAAATQSAWQLQAITTWGHDYIGWLSLAASGHNYIGQLSQDIRKST